MNVDHFPNFPILKFYWNSTHFSSVTCQPPWPEDWTDPTGELRQWCGLHWLPWVEGGECGSLVGRGIDPWPVWTWPWEWRQHPVASYFCRKQRGFQAIHQVLIGVKPTWELWSHLASNRDGPSWRSYRYQAVFQTDVYVHKNQARTVWMHQDLDLKSHCPILSILFPWNGSKWLFQ